MTKNNKTGIKFCGTTVLYGKTTLEKFLNFGYSVKREQLEYHEESATLMVGFFKDGNYLGELVFYNILPDAELSQLQNKPIDFVLLEDRAIERNENFWQFLDFAGKYGQKNVRFIVVAYLFAWALIAFFEIAWRVWGEPFGQIPVEIIVVYSALPVAFMSVAFMFWCIKSFFRYCFVRFSRLEFYAIFVAAIFAWNSVLTLAFVQLREATWQSIPLIAIPLTFLLLITVFAAYQLVMIFLDALWNTSGKLAIRQLACILLLWTAAIPMIYFFKKSELTIQSAGFFELFLTLLMFQYLLFAATLIRYVVRLFGILIKNKN